jgi:hypothetical protein
MMICVFVAVPAIGQDGSAHAVTPTKGKMLVAVNGSRLGPVYRVTPDGSVQVIIDGKMATIPAATLSMTNGELTTSLSKSDVIATH